MPNEEDKAKAEKEYTASVEDEINGVLDTIRPFIERDGGDVRLVKYEDGVVYVKLYGACVGCMAMDETLQDGIESILKEEIPEVVKVVNVDQDSNDDSIKTDELGNIEDN